MDNRNEEVVNFINYRKRILQEESFRKEIQTIIQKSNADDIKKVEYKIYYPSESTKKVTAAERQAIYEIAFSSPQYSFDIWLMIFEEFIKKELQKKFKIKL